MNTSTIRKNARRLVRLDRRRLDLCNLIAESMPLETPPEKRLLTELEDVEKAIDLIHLNERNLCLR